MDSNILVNEKISSVELDLNEIKNNDILMKTLKFSKVSYKCFYKLVIVLLLWLVSV